MDHCKEITLQRFSEPIRAVVVGASGGIGRAFVLHLLEQKNVDAVYALSRSKPNINHSKLEYFEIDFADEQKIEHAADVIKEYGGVNLVIVASGVLHDKGVHPEKALKDINTDQFAKAFAVNTTGPALIAKYFLPLLPKNERGIFAALSARVGSISDNELGGWYAYRASKAALNMVLKTAAIEMARRYKKAIIVGLHPGTVDTQLSEPFQGNVPEGKLFDAAYSTAQMLNVLDGLSPDDSGLVFDYAGDKIEP